MLDIRRLQYLEAVYRHKNFTRASEEIFVSQPTISAAVRAMEKEYGVTLIHRTPREVVFTQAGEALVARARRILNEHEQAERMLRDFSGPAVQSLRLGLSPTQDVWLLQELHESFLPARPNLRLYLDGDSMLGHIGKLREGSLDIAYNILPERPREYGMEAIPLAEGRVCVLLPPGHPLERQKVISLRELEREPLSLLEEGSGVRAAVLRAFERAELCPQAASSHTQIISMLNMVRLGGHIGFISLGVDGSAPGCEGLVLRQLEEPIILRTGFLFKKDTYIPRAAAELSDFVRSAVERKKEAVREASAQESDT